MGRKSRRSSSPRSSRSGKSSRSRASRGSRSSTRPLTGVPPVEIEAGPGGEEEEIDRSKTWSSRICACGNCKSCCYAIFCVPCAVATARTRFDGSSWCVNLCCLNICVARNIIREGYGIEGHCCMDICCSVMCGPCVVCQLLDETANRGSIVDRWMLNPHRPAFEQPWKFGLCACCEDPKNCAYACFCPPCALGTVRTQFDTSDWIFNCCCLNAFVARSIVRQGYNIEGSAKGDVCSTCCCYPCVLCQMLNETQHRGRINVPGVGAPVQTNYMQR